VRKAFKAELRSPFDLIRLRPGSRFELMQQYWSPTACLLAGTAGALVGAWGWSRSGFTGLMTSAAGFSLLARAATNLELGRLFGVGAGRGAGQPATDHRGRGADRKGLGAVEPLLGLPEFHESRA
jgi:hypothetical protein